MSDLSDFTVEAEHKAEFEAWDKRNYTNIAREAHRMGWRAGRVWERARIDFLMAQERGDDGDS